MMMNKILRCGWCGVFCDNTGRIFEATEQLKKADEIVGFDNCKGECNKCRPSRVLDDIEEEFHNTVLASHRAKVNRKMSTGDY